MTLLFTSLPGAAEEGHGVGQVLPGTTLLQGADATEGAVKTLHGPRVLHIATHGFFLKDLKPIEAPRVKEAERNGVIQPLFYYPENPLLRSGLALAGANKRQSGNDDGVLTALEASQLDLTGTNLVVLSACETGVGKAENGEGVYGLRRALVMAGAETQVMSLWKVDDAATRELMEAYYRGLAQGGGRSEAMRQVGLAMLRKPTRAHPYYWASFIVSGNPSPLPVAPDLPRVQPGPRGCGCEVGARPSANPGAWLALMVTLLSVCLRRSGSTCGPLPFPPRA